ncbi:hypothetical protein [Edaphovirga cremea]|uniref:hypothetical protein n=1 Tax=Edaphovirga cremea TaxID=2267246 RepID=UPI003989CA5D
MAKPDTSGAIDFEGFGGWLRIMSDGLYVNHSHENEVELTPAEAAALSAHPTGDLSKPVLQFPFTIKRLISFLEFINDEGCDFPISKKYFTISSLARKNN